MSASFKVNQPAEFTIQIGVKIQNGTLTVQPHVLPQQAQLQRPVQTSRTLAPAASPDKNLDNLVRGMNSLSMNNDLVEDSSAPPRIQSRIESQEPPARLNQTKRRERASLRPHPIGIPNVPDTEDCARAQRRATRSSAAQSGAADHEGFVLIHKAPDGGRPLRPGDNASKLMRCPEDLVAECKDELDEMLENNGYESEENDQDRRRRQPSYPAPYNSPHPSGGSSHGSSSPPASYHSVPTPSSTVDGSVASGPVAGPALVISEQPPRRGRGRPRKVRPEGAPAQPAASRTSGGNRLQPKPSFPIVDVMKIGGGGGIADFISPGELAEAGKVIKHYTAADMSARYNDQGELLPHMLARERNWAKVVALNIRWLSNASLDDLFTGINTESSMGRTAIIEAVDQQNAKAVKYCCLFTCNSDVHLYRALVESALLESDEIFDTILQAMCHEMDENGNQVKRTNRFIDSPISGWSFSNNNLSSYAGLTLAQALTVESPKFHHRLKALISYGANPSQTIGQDAVEKYRAYINCVYLAAAFSPKPFECLVALGVRPDVEQPIGWDRSRGETLKWCVSTICGRTELDANYRDFVRQSLSRSALAASQPNLGMQILAVEDVEDFLFGLDCQFKADA